MQKQTMYVAQPYVAGSPDAEVIGQVVMAFSQNLRAEVIEPLLPKYGLDNIDPEAWYPHQAWMNVLRDVEENVPNAWETFVAFGKQVVEDAVMPPEITTIPAVLDLLHDIHHMNLRNIPADEGYTIEHITDTHYLVYHNTPNPNSAIYGFIWGLVARYKADDEVFVVRQIDNAKPAQIPGSVFEVKWGPDQASIQ